MTDTGQVPGEGLPENAGMVEQPGVPAHGAYTYLSETTAEDEDLLLLPGAQSPWGNEVAPPAPEPVVETVHEPGPHETAGRDSGSVDLSAVRLPEPTPPRRRSRPRRAVRCTSARRSRTPPASPVRSLADRGPAGAPVRQPGPPTHRPRVLRRPPAPRDAPAGRGPVGRAGTGRRPDAGRHRGTRLPKRLFPCRSRPRNRSSRPTPHGPGRDGHRPAQHDGGRSRRAGRAERRGHVRGGGPGATYDPEAGQIPAGVSPVEGAELAGADPGVADVAPGGSSWRAVRPPSGLLPRAGPTVCPRAAGRLNPCPDGGRFGRGQLLSLGCPDPGPADVVGAVAETGLAPGAGAAAEDGYAEAAVPGRRLRRQRKPGLRRRPSRLLERCLRRRPVSSRRTPSRLRPLRPLRKRCPWLRPRHSRRVPPPTVRRPLTPSRLRTCGPSPRRPSPRRTGCRTVAPGAVVDAPQGTSAAERDRARQRPAPRAGRARGARRGRSAPHNRSAPEAAPLPEPAATEPRKALGDGAGAVPSRSACRGHRPRRGQPVVPDPQAGTAEEPLQAADVETAQRPIRLYPRSPRTPPRHRP